MSKMLIIYQTKYGSTKEIAEKLALILGPASVITPLDFSEKYYDFDPVVIGSPVYGEKLLPDIEQFISKNASWLQSKKVALFAVGINPSSQSCLPAITGQLKSSVVWTGYFGGIIVPSVLDKNDYDNMEAFSKATGFELKRIDMRKQTELVKKALELKRLLKNTHNMPDGKLKKRIEEFLLSHNTCTLCTGQCSGVRATPIEYLYQNGSLYFLSEGGEKFANLMLNNNVSVAVYDNYGGFDKLAGLQITGKAELIPFKSSEYMNIIAAKGIDAEKLSNLPVRLNMIKVVPVICEFLFSCFAKEGYDVKQSINYQA